MKSKKRLGNYFLEMSPYGDISICDVDNLERLAKAIKFI